MDSVKAEVPHNRLGLIGIFAALVSSMSCVDTTLANVT